LVLAGLVRSIAATTGPIFHGVGKPRIDTVWQIIRLIVLIALIYPFTMRWGILGTSIAVLFSILVSTLGFGFTVIRITRCRIQTFSKMIAFPLLNGIIVVLSIFFLKRWINTIGISEFFLFLAISISIYIILTYFLDRFLKYGIGKQVRESLAILKI